MWKAYGRCKGHTRNRARQILTGALAVVLSIVYGGLFTVLGLGPDCSGIMGHVVARWDV